MAVSDDDRQQLLGVLNEYFTAWKSLDRNAVKRIWDQTYESPVYIAAEHEQPMIGWPAIDEYLGSSTPTQVQRIKVAGAREVWLDVLGEAAYVFSTAYFEVEFKNGQALTIKPRDTMSMRRRDGKWKVILYHESRPAPL